MDLTKIVSISGKPGLFQVTGQGKNSVVVESLIDGKRFPAFAQDKMSSLEEISIFTTNEDLPLKEVFRAINEKIGESLDFDPKKISGEQLKEKFALAVPDYDVDAVYTSDMKKVFSWYQLLSDKEILDFTEKEEDTEQAESAGDEPTTAEIE
jgi:hypothetical protein